MSEKRTESGEQTIVMPAGWADQFRREARERETLPPPPVRERIAEAAGLVPCPCCKGGGYVTEEVALMVEPFCPEDAPASRPTRDDLPVVDAVGKVEKSR